MAGVKCHNRCSSARQRLHPVQPVRPKPRMPPLSPRVRTVMASAQAPLIAVVEPDPALMRLLEQALSMDGFRILQLTRGEASAAAIEENKANLIVMDTWLENQESGWQLYDELRKGDATSKIPLVICSSDPDEMKARAEVFQGNGLVTVLNKPFDPDVLVDRIRSMLARAG